MEKISVIVPVYNVEAYLDRCVQSIVDQTYRHLEIILVDDGSADRCGGMCDEWAQKDDRIRVIHKENGGLSDARNAGMRIATGDYIGFVDSDDWIEPSMYDILLQRMKRTQSDISACGVQMDWEDGRTDVLTPAGSRVLDHEQAMKAIIDEGWIKQPVWYKLYKRSVVEKLSFAVGKYHEDVFWSYQAVAGASCVSVTDEQLYHYTQRQNSIMGTAFRLSRLDAIEAKIERQRFLSANYPQLEAYGKANLFFSCMYMGQKAICSLKGNDLLQAKRRLTQVIRALPLTWNDIRTESFSHRVWMMAAKANLIWTCRIRNMLGVGL